MTSGSSVDTDVVVVGGGVAGLAAASSLGHLDVMVLEAGDRLGGRLHSLPRDETWINLGAHLLTGGDSTITRLMAASGLDVIPVPGIKTALWFDGKLRVGRRVEAFPVTLPLSLRERLDLVRVGLALRLGAELCRRAARVRRDESVTCYNRRLRRYRADRTFADTVRGVAPRVAAIFTAAARRSGGEADRLTEGGAMALFGALWVSSGSASVVNVAGGSGRFGDVWGRRLGSRAITGATVTSVVERSEYAEVVYRGRDGEEQVVKARHVIVAVPAPEARRLVVDLPDDVRRELDGVTYGPFVCMGVLTKDLPAMKWDDVYAITAPDTNFDMLFHQSNPVLNSTVTEPRPRSFMCYAGGDKAAALLDLDDDEIRSRFLPDLVDVLPELRGMIDEVVVKKWRYGNCYPAGAGTGLDRSEAWNRRPGALVKLAGDYFAPLGGTLEAAARSGIGHAAEVLGRIG